MGSRSGFRTLALPAALVVLCIAVSWFLAPRLANQGPLVLLLGVLGAAVLVSAMAVPRHWIPAIALAVFAFFPRRLFDGLPLIAEFSPSVLLIVIWILRSVIERPSRGQRPVVRTGKPRVALIVLVSVTSAWLLISLVSTTSLGTSVPWVIVFALLCLALPFVPDPMRSIRSMQAMWAVLAVVLGAYAVLESLAQVNYFYDPVYAFLGQDPVQHWAVYRASATFGHPLHAGLFFSMGVGISLGRRLEGGSRWYLLAAAVGALGAAVTVSRSALLAMVLASIAAFVPALFMRSRLSIGSKVVSALGITLAGTFVLLLPQVQERLTSDEASDSTGAREVAFDLAGRVAGVYNWIGSGPATSAEASRPFNANYILIENGYLQLLVSIGIPGLILFVALLVASIIRAVALGRFAAVAALVAYALSIFLFNILESNPYALLLLGFALLMAWAPRAPADGPPPQAGEIDAVPERPGKLVAHV